MCLCTGLPSSIMPLWWCNRRLKNWQQISSPLRSPASCVPQWIIYSKRLENKSEQRSFKFLNKYSKIYQSWNSSFLFFYFSSSNFWLKQVTCLLRRRTSHWRDWQRRQNWACALALNSIFWDAAWSSKVASLSNRWLKKSYGRNIIHIFVPPVYQ